MSDYKFDTDYLEVGDTFEGGPIEQSYFISAIMAVGGEIEVDGDIVRVLQLPKKDVPKAKAPVAVVAKEEEAPLVDLASEEAVVEEAPAPKKPSLQTRKPKAVPSSETTEPVVSKDKE